MGSHVNVGRCISLDPSHGDLGYGQGQTETILEDFTDRIRKRNGEIGHTGSGGNTGAGCYHFRELGEGDKLFVGKEICEGA
jgi:hypothetical protein